MTGLSKISAVLALSTCLCGPMLAQSSATPDQNMPNAPTTAAPSTTSPSTSPSSPTQGQMTATDLTGQTIYSAKGHKIGTVSAMSTDAQGQQAAAVSVEKYLGMGGQTVLIPVSTLQARDGGGYTTNLSSTELKALPKASSGSTP